MLYLLNILSLALLSRSFGASSSVSGDPISFHDLAVVQPSGDTVIRLRGYDLDGDVVYIHLKA